MDNYITSATIKRIREEKGYTQAQLAEKIGVSSKAVSKWETAKGLPDITLIEPLAQALGVCIQELMSGETAVNKNIASNMLRSEFYACPLCGNIIRATGETFVSCCGITLPALDAEDTDDAHEITIERVEDEYFVCVKHEMTKTHFISFIAHITTDWIHFHKLYPEENAEARFSLRGRGYLYIYCNRHGLMKKKI